MTEADNVGIEGIVKIKLLLQGRGYLLAKSLLRQSFCSFILKTDNSMDYNHTVGELHSWKIKHTE